MPTPSPPRRRTPVRATHSPRRWRKTDTRLGRIPIRRHPHACTLRRSQALSANSGGDEHALRRPSSRRSRALAAISRGKRARLAPSPEPQLPARAAKPGSTQGATIRCLDMPPHWTRHRSSKGGAAGDEVNILHKVGSQAPACLTASRMSTCPPSSMAGLRLQERPHCSTPRWDLAGWGGRAAQRRAEDDDRGPRADDRRPRTPRSQPSRRTMGSQRREMERGA